MSILARHAVCRDRRGNIGRILLVLLLNALRATMVQPHICDFELEMRTPAGAQYSVGAAALHDEVVCQPDVWLVATSPGSVADVVKALAGVMRTGQTGGVIRPSRAGSLSGGAGLLLEYL